MSDLNPRDPQGQPRRVVFGQTQPPQDEVVASIEEAPQVERTQAEAGEGVPAACEGSADIVEIAANAKLQLEHPLMGKVRELVDYAHRSEPVEPQSGDEDISANPLDGPPDLDLRRMLSEKVKEFRFLGYGHFTEDDLWMYMQQLRKNRPRNLHEVVNAILALQPQAVMNFGMQSAYRNTTESLEDILNDLG